MKSELLTSGSPPKTQPEAETSHEVMNLGWPERLWSPRLTSLHALNSWGTQHSPPIIRGRQLQCEVSSSTWLNEGVWIPSKISTSRYGNYKLHTVVRTWVRPRDFNGTALNLVDTAFCFRKLEKVSSLFQKVAAYTSKAHTTAQSTVWDHSRISVNRAEVGSARLQDRWTSASENAWGPSHKKWKAKYWTTKYKPSVDRSVCLLLGCLQLRRC